MRVRTRYDLLDKDPFHFPFHGKYFILFHLSVYMVSLILKFLNDMEIYSPCGNIYTIRSIK
jgi:hypothetical protein